VDFLQIIVKAPADARGLRHDALAVLGELLLVVTLPKLANAHTSARDVYVA
jgi:hypothetical protein